MEKITLNDMYKLSKAAAMPLLFDETIVDTFPYLSEYVANFADFDRQIARTMGLQYPIFNIESLSDSQEVWDEFKADCASVVRRYNYNLSKLFKLIELEYNPLENYNRHEESTDENNGSSTDINSYGAVQDTESLGQVKVSNQYGAVNGSETLGNTRTENEYGMTDKTNENKIAGFNSTDYSDSTKQTSVENAHTDISTTDTVVNSSITQEHTDVNTKDAVTNTRSKAEHEDVMDNEHRETNKRISDITGNIGVMSTQQMFEQEWNIIKNYNPYDVLLKLISNDLLVLFSEGYSAMNTTLQNELLML